MPKAYGPKMAPMKDNNPNTSSTQSHEIDFKDLQPGSVISQEQVESIVGTTRDSDPEGYAYKLMAFTDQVRREMGRPDLTVINRSRGVAVLTHSESSTYNATAFARGLSKSRAAHRRMQGVDTEALTGAERQSHDRKVMSQSRILSAIRGVRAEMRIEQEDERPALRG